MKQRWPLFLLWFIVIVVASSALAPILSPHLPFTFQHVLMRILEALLLIWLIIFLPRLNIGFKDALRYANFDLSLRGYRALLKGFLVGVFFLVLSAYLEIRLSVRIKTNLFVTSLFSYGALKALLTGIVVGLIEEVVFRGWLFKSLKKFGLWVALILSSLIYASLHFFQSTPVEVSSSPSFFDGFRVIFSFLHTIAHPIPILPALVGLFVFGFILAYAYERTGSIMMSIGLHAGAVFALKHNANWARVALENPELRETIWVGSKVMYDGALGWMCLAGMFLLVWVLLVLEKLMMRRKESGRSVG